jgi:hypothetical protein
MTSHFDDDNFNENIYAINMSSKEDNYINNTSENGLFFITSKI